MKLTYTIEDAADLLGIRTGSSLRAQPALGNCQLSDLAGGFWSHAGHLRNCLDQYPTITLRRLSPRRLKQAPDGTNQALLETS